MKIEGILEDIKKGMLNAAGSSIDDAGASVCGPLWPIVRAVAEPVLARLRDTPDARVAELLQEWKLEDQRNKQGFEIARAVVSALDEQQLVVLRSLAHARADIAALRQHRECQTRSALHRLKETIPLWHSVWMPRATEEKPRSAIKRLHASRNELRIALWAVGYDPRWLVLEAHIPQPEAMAHLNTLAVAVFRDLAFKGLFDLVAMTFGEETAVGFAVLVYKNDLDDPSTKDRLLALSSARFAERLYDDLLRLIRPGGKKPKVVAGDDEIINVTASWA